MINDIAAVCCLFNVNKSEKRLNNYKLFFEKFKKTKIELLTVELALGDAPFELNEYPNVIQVRSDSILWHKERLMNIGIEKLINDGYEKIMWLDADIIFEHTENLAHDISKELDNNIICQLFSSTCDLNENYQLDENSRRRNGIVKELTENINELEKNIFNANNRNTVFILAHGLAWAARSDLLKKTLLFDKGIVGGGDAYMIFSFLQCEKFKYVYENQFKHACIYKEIPSNNGFNNVFNKWGKNFSSLINGKVGCIDNVIYSMYHGEIEDRQYCSRHDILNNNGYDPGKHLKLNKYNCFEWSSQHNFKKLIDEVKVYFKKRIH